MARRSRQTRSRRRARVPAGRRARLPRGMTLPGGVYKFKRTSYNPALITAGILDIAGASAFNLNLVPNASEFTSLFDQYRIDKIVWTLMPRGNSAEQGTNNTNTKIFSVLDYDDETAPANLNTLLQYPNVKCTTLSRDHKRTLVPKFATQTYISAVATGYGARTGWLDCDNSNVPHFGVKYFIQAPGAGTQVIDVKTDFYLSFKGVR